jgi:hypothetical protein
MTKVTLRFKKQHDKITMLPVRYIYLDAGEFLYDQGTGRLFSTETPHKFCGTLQEIITCPYASQYPLQTPYVGDLQSQQVYSLDDEANRRM